MYVQLTYTMDLKEQADQIERCCVTYSLRQLNRVVTNIYNSELSAVGITNSQFNILTAIAKMQPVSPGKVAKVLHLEKSSISRTLEGMHRNGWLQAEGNGRSQQLTITENGEEIYLKAFGLWERAQEISLQLMGSEVADTLRSAAKAVPTD